MSVQVPTPELLALLLASLRVAAWLVVCPPFNSSLVPMPVKLLLSVGLALPVVPGQVAHVPSLATAALLASAVEQIVVGAALGFLTALFFLAVQSAGDLVDLFGGMALAFAFDPLSANQSSVFGRFYNLLATALLFASGGYQLVVRGFLASYRTVDLTGTLSLARMSRMLGPGLADMFLAALQIAGPLIAVLFCADVALGLLNRVSPALNAFALGFPAKIMLTLLLAGMAFTLLPRAVESIVEQAVRAVVTAAGG